MMMRLAVIGDWVKREVAKLGKKQTTLEINPDKAYSIQEFQDEHGGQKYKVVVIIQALLEGVQDDAE